MSADENILQGKIIRVIKNADNPFVMIDKRPLENPLMSWRAKGLLAYLLSRPDNWEIRLGHLVKQASDSEYITRQALRELMAVRHIKKQIIRQHGKIYKHLYEVYEIPYPPPPDQLGLFDKNQQVENQQVEIQQVDFLLVENRAVNNKDSNENDLNENDLKAEAEASAAAADHLAQRLIPPDHNFPFVTRPPTPAHGAGVKSAADKQAEKLILEVSRLSGIGKNREAVERVSAMMDTYTHAQVKSALELCLTHWLQQTTKDGQLYKRSNIGGWVEWADNWLVDGLEPWANAVEANARRYAQRQEEIEVIRERLESETEEAEPEFNIEPLPTIKARWPQYNQTPEQAWRDVYQQLNHEMPPAAFSAWVRDLILYDADPQKKVITIAAKDQETRAWVDARLTSKVNRFLQGALSENARAEFVVVE